MSKKGLRKTRVMEMLPEVGDRRMEVPTIDETMSAIGPNGHAAQRCTVIEVNRAHMWYRVRFDNGFTECYKLPRGEAGLR
jgi:hypothetical protein